MDRLFPTAIMESKINCVIFRTFSSNEDIDFIFVNPATCARNELVLSDEIQDNENLEISQYTKLNNYKYIVTLSTDSTLGSAIGYTCRRSEAFVKSLIKYCRYHGVIQKNCDIKPDSGCHTVIIVSMNNPRRYWLDFIWSSIIHTLVYRHIAFEDGMAWLNTLGGGYSALGDYFHHHAKSAAQISLQQLRIALEVGDPGMEIRCRLYYAQSLMQQGRLRRSKYALRHLYRNEALVKCPHDHRLHAMCHGLWNRLKYCYASKTVKRSKRKLSAGSNNLHHSNGVTAS